MLVFAIPILLNSEEADGFYYTSIPAVQVKTIPTQDEFLSKDKSEILKNYQHFTANRDNGERVESYFLYSVGKDSDSIFIFYFEDKTDKRLQYYEPTNSDFFLLYFKPVLSSPETQLVFAERHGKGCIATIKDENKPWTEYLSSCEAGTAIIKTTKDGWAAYVKFFKPILAPTADKPYYIQWIYDDLQDVKDNEIEKETPYFWPLTDEFVIVTPIISIPSYVINGTSGTVQTDDFLFKPRDILTRNLKMNIFSCADNTIQTTVDKKNYQKDDVARISVSVNTQVELQKIFLRIYDMQGKVVYQSSKQASIGQESLFLVDLERLGDGLYSVVAEYGIDGPKNELKFSVGNIQLPKEEKDQCYFYALYNKSTSNLSVLANLNDPSSSEIDRLQLFVDRKGDSVNELNSDDIAYVIGKNQFGALRYHANGGWLVDQEHEEKGDGRLKQISDRYQVLFNIPDVSSNFKLALEQIDDNKIEIKKSKFPQNSYSTVPASWANIVVSDIPQQKIAADRWRPEEIILQQNVQVNLILVGDEWKSSIQNQIKTNLESTYKPIILSELERIGSQYNYEYNFFSASEQASTNVFDFMKEKAMSLRPFFGENEFDEPWGIALWIKNNHTEWVDTSQKRYNVEYRLIDAEKMEDFLYDNIIKTDDSLNRPNSVNLIFIADDMTKVNFLHNYQLKKFDSATSKPHNALGLMGYGGRYNFYFFDLYAVPWHGFQGSPFFYDQKLQNYATNFHDIKTEDKQARLITDYVNNATSLIITPTYLYPPVYKNSYMLDLVIVAKSESGSGTATTNLLKYFIDVSKIKSQLESLVPYSKWEVKVTLEKVDSQNLPEKFKQAIQSAETISPYPWYPDYTIDILDSTKVSQQVVEWATTRSSSNFIDYKDVEKSSWTIPVVITIGSRDKPIYLYNEGIILQGFASPHPDDPTQPCCALGVTYDNAVWDDKVSVTDLVLHEVGHTLSLMHPFMGYSANDVFFVNEYFNWYGSVMAYNSPPQGCGQWFSDYVGEPCGISDTFYTKFEKDNFARGVTIYLMKAAENNVYRSLIQLEGNGKDLNNLDEEVKTTLDLIQTKLKHAEDSFKVNELTSENGAVKAALAAAIESERLAEQLNVSYEPPTPSNVIELQIPAWIKNNAKWWAAGSISEDDFINGIQYLVKERIIVVPDVVKSGENAGQKVPVWVKDNADWWSKGVISDKEFVAALQYLIKEGVIIVGN